MNLSDQGEDFGTIEPDPAGLLFYEVQGRSG